ncbi:MAG: oxidoreductase [Bacteroides sp. SM23_62_1]|nr:MAG: oxidoreductase [Bacteroides sp. SM23_62_1]
MKSRIVFIILFILLSACKSQNKQFQDGSDMFTGKRNEIKLITLDPGHFHAALVQKIMYETVDSVVHVFAPEGQDVLDHLARIEGFNSRIENPTSWVEKVYTGPDFLDRMLRIKSGNVIILSGNNARKTEYIDKAVKAGLNVLADKPMVITHEDFTLLEEAFRTAAEKGVLLYDIMTERYEITNILQRELSMITEVFGELIKGTPEDPAITKESVHHFFKYVSGSPLIRPAWFFDVRQQGEGIVDVSTHLVDLIQWEAFPDRIMDKSDIEVLSARRWSTDLTIEQFSKVTGIETFPEYLSDNVEDGVLKVFSNGEILYTLRGINAKVSVAWNYQAPEGTGDTHYSIMKGTRCNLVIRQGESENFQPTLYVELNENVPPALFENDLIAGLEDIAVKYPGVGSRKKNDRTWIIDIPDKYKVDHEAHFGQVMEKFLQYLQDGKLPDWEVPNMITKYYTTTRALEMAGKRN